MHTRAEVHKPPVLPLIAEGVPAELRVRPRWVGFRLVLRDGRWAKVPYDVVSGGRARTNYPNTWASFGRALACYRRGLLDGVGYVLSKDDPFAGVDLDGCRDPESGEIAAWAAAILAELDSYAEVSPSGTGVKIIVNGSLPCDYTGGQYHMGNMISPSGRPAGFAMYHWARFFALTGMRVDGVPATVESRDVVLTVLWWRVADRMRYASVEPWPPRTQPGGRMSLSDTALLDRARNAPNGDRFRQLYDDGNLDAYGGDHSLADLALCGLLAFWTHGNEARIDRFFRTSALMRPKWDERHAADGTTYGQMTIARALGI